MQPTSIKEKIGHTLEETRVVLPGTQALLGFQLAAIFQQGFPKLSYMLQYMHLLSLVCVAVSTIFLLAVASFHRIAEEGQDTARFHSFASAMIICSLIMLTFGLSTDMYVVTNIISRSQIISIVSGLSTLSISIVMWFGLPFYIKNKSIHFT